MLGYEKVNKRTEVSPKSVAPLVSEHHLDRRSAPASKPRRPKARRRLIDLSALAAEAPCESIARETEIVAQLAMADDYAERPSEHFIAEQLQGLVDPDVIRSL
jgi:hypothetical protein